MKKKISFLLFFILFFTYELNAKQTHFKVSYDPDYAPFSYSEDNKPVGLLIDYWKLWAEQNNYTVEFINGKLWKDAIDLVYTEKADYFLGTEPYQEWMKGSKSFYNRKTSIFILKDNGKGFAKTAPYIIGIITHEYEKYIKKQFPNSEVIVYEDYPTIFEDFISKKIDLMYEDKIAVEFYTLRNNIFHDIKSIELLNNVSQIQAIAKDDKHIKIFNEGLKKLKQKDLYDIESKWIINEKQRYYKNINDFTLTSKEKQFLKEHIIKVTTSKDWKPFTFANDLNNTPNGISQEIWQLLIDKTSLKSEYSIYTKFTNQLEAIKTKKADIIYSTGKTKEREKYSLFTKPYIKFPISITTLKDENFIESMDYLKNKVVAVGKNYTAHKLLKQYYPNLNFLLVNSVKEGFTAVREKRAYAFLYIKPVLTYNINKYKFDDLKISGNSGLTFELRIMIRDDYKILQNILNKAIDTISQEQINTLISRWDNVQFEHETDYKTLWLLLFIISIIILISLYINKLNMKRNKNLQEIVEQRTLELQLLNENLEHKIESKTKELRKVNYLLDEAQKIAHLGSFQYHISKNQLYWSDELYKIFGYFIEEVTPSIDLLLNCVHKDDKLFVNKQIEKALNSDKKVTFEFKIRLKNSVIKYLQYTSKITKFDINNKPIMMIGTILDLTKLKNLEKEKLEKDALLAQQTKMAAMGEMLENIAHQWRQPLSVISTTSTGMQLQIELDTQIPQELLLNNLKQINEHTQYLSKTIDDFRNFFNPNKIQLEFDIKDSIEKSLYLIEGRLKEHDIEVIKEIDSIQTYSLENELIQVLLNIFNNAIDALQNIDGNKYIFIKIRSVRKELILEITDNAKGIPDTIINRVFEPYFTTKYKSQGTGIGLYMSNEIISKHLFGSIQVNNSTYRYNKKSFTGAKFTITLPIRK